MKKKALCIFILVFWLVGACTFLSLKVEKQMVPQVATVELNGFGSDSLPADCLMMGENGLALYSLYEGTGWEAGVRVQEAGGGWQLDGDKLKLENGWGTYVQYSSKPLKSGELVDEVRGGRPEPDYWLAALPSGAGAPDLSGLPDGVEIVEQSESAVLLSVEGVAAPFMEARAKSLIPGLYQAKVYSFGAMSQFLDNFAGLGTLLFLFTAALALWVWSCVLTRKARQNRAALLVNLALGLALLACVPLALGAVDLPSSLLPRLHITDFGYYAQEMKEFFGSLATFAPKASEQGYLAPNLPQSEAGQAIIQQKNIMIARPFLYGVGGLAFGSLLALGEYCAMKVRRRPRIK